jgi:hypothetical protein
MSAAIARPLPAAGLLAGQERLGLYPPITLLAATGLVIVAFANTLARVSGPGATTLWWVGLLAITAPAAIRLLSRAAGRGERVAIVATTGLALYIVKLLHGPGAFVMFDELQHTATLLDIMENGRLFTFNTVLVASPYYPGVEVLADLLGRSGLPVWESGALVIGAARLLHVIAMFLLFERVSGSARIAGVGTLIYMTNPSFLFFDAQFSYESVALPLATYAVWLIARREPVAESPEPPSRPGRWWFRVHPAGGFGTTGGTRLGLTILTLLAIGSVVVTHHVSAIALSGFLVAWAVVSLGYKALRRRGGADVVTFAIVSVVATSAWMLYVATVTVRYLAPAVGSAVTQVIDLVGGEESGRELFRSATGQAAPAWEQGLGYASVAVALLLLPIGLPMVWRRYRDRSAAMTLALVALLYPVTLVARLTPRGAELSARSAEFVFLGVGFVGAVGLVTLMERFTEWRSSGPGRTGGRLARRRAAPAIPTSAVSSATADPDAPVLQPVLPPPVPPDRRIAFGLRAAAVLGILVLSTGGVILGIPAWARLPGPYLVSADPRSIEPQGLSAAAWTARWLRPDSRFLSDRTNRMLLAVYGRQHPITAVGDRIDVKEAFFGSTLSAESAARIARAGVRYVIADRRLATSLPYVGVYMERGELTSRGPWLMPMSIAAFDKWETIDGSDRIYDAGAIRIFDVRGLTGAR